MVLSYLNLNINLNPNKTWSSHTGLGTHAISESNSEIFVDGRNGSFHQAGKGYKLILGKIHCQADTLQMEIIVTTKRDHPKKEKKNTRNILRDHRVNIFNCMINIILKA